MAIDPDKLLNRDFGSVRETYSEKDCILYALGVGMGLDPLDENCLRFVYEDDFLNGWSSLALKPKLFECSWQSVANSQQKGFHFSKY